MMSTEARRTRAEIAAETREAILSAACEIIGEEGFEKIRMRMVAERAVCPRRPCTTTSTTARNSSPKPFATPSSTPVAMSTKRPLKTIPRQSGWPIISASLPTTESLRREWAMYQELWCRANREPEARAVAIELNRAQQGWIEETLADGIASGEFAKCDTVALAGLISSLCDGLGVQLMFGNPSLSIDSARATIWAQAAATLGIPNEFPKDGR